MGDMNTLPPIITATTLRLSNTETSSITATTLRLSNTETSSLTPFCAIAPQLVPVSKIQIQITLETIYEEDEEEEDDDEIEQSSETPASSSPPLIFSIKAATCSFQITGSLLLFGHNYQCA
ncbi:hypothetical protein VNO77_01409 [Canavalia gladiata]|uniref:Uncharacterized protein n=1 Tax=Canavalia gladiata TaxID=3824 RepID=A0AAN9R693_CANGL